MKLSQDFQDTNLAADGPQATTRVKTGRASTDLPAG
jgi:hypothetical protein